MTNMTHPPQEVLLKVMCSERLPEKSGIYITKVNDRESLSFSFFNGVCFASGSGFRVTSWYEPATRIVLTEEEYSGICMKQYDEGYSDATKEARDEIANNYRPNDN